MNELNFVNDLVVHTAPAARSRAIDRYARSAQLAPGSDEALVLEAMRVARFAILVIERRHEVADWSPPICPTANRYGWSTSASKHPWQRAP
jgi:hypothetical protein